jgi:hypothetical protein
MDHAVIPDPARFEAGSGPGFAFRPGTVVVYADTGMASAAGRFCAQIARRAGVRLTPRQGGPVPGYPCVTIKRAAPGELASTVDWALPRRGPDILALDQAFPSRGHAAVPSSRDRGRPGSGPR